MVEIYNDRPISQRGARIPHFQRNMIENRIERMRNNPSPYYQYFNELNEHDTLNFASDLRGNTS